jgi:hypothetical protein
VRARVVVERPLVRHVLGDAHHWRLMQSWSRMPEVVLIDHGGRAVRRTAVMARFGNVVPTSTIGDAETRLRTRRVDVIVTEYAFADGTALDACRVAAAAPSSPSVLVAWPDVCRVAELIAAGCHAIVPRPADVDVLCSRVRRILRARQRTHPPSANGVCGTRDPGTNESWSDRSCPRCARAGVYSFDITDHGRAWYACTRCRHVWLDVRPDRHIGGRTGVT